MATDPLGPEVLVSVTHDVEAAAIVGALAEHGIRSRAVGGYTSGFRAEAPGEVKVVVARADLARARAILTEFQSHPAEVDWSAVDFDEGLAPDDGSTDEDVAVISADTPPRFQFSIATLLVLQSVASVALAACKSLFGHVSFLAVFSVVFVALMALTPILIVAGTVAVAADMNRARQAWRYFVAAMLAGAGLLAIFAMLAKIAGALGL